MTGLVTRRALARLAAGFAFAVVGLLLTPPVLAEAPASEAVLRATLPNGLKVVIVPNALAPVVSTSLNYYVGSNDVPEGFPGTAHALEHMMFRGSPGLSSQALANINRALGSNNNANTRETMTQYYYVVPAEDLDVALHVEASRMAGLDCTDKDWDTERGAIEQEVSGDLSNPRYKALEVMRERLFAGTPYAHTPLGTRMSFDKTTAADLKKFHDDWYAPNNAVLIVVGDVEPKATLAKIAMIFGGIEAKTLPVRNPVNFKPVEPGEVTIDYDQPYTLTYLYLRVPGHESEEEPALEVLGSVMASQRFALYSMVAEGRALDTGFGYTSLKTGGIAFIAAAIPPGADVKAAQDEMRAIVAKVLKDGVPPELVEAVKLQKRRLAEQQKNSIEGQASIWANALVEDGLSSPDEALARIEKVTVEDVNRVARKYLTFDTAFAVNLVSNGNAKPAAPGKSGKESLGISDAAPAELPVWATAALARLSVPKPTMTPTVSTLPNGLTLIVQPTKVSDIVSLHGMIRTTSEIQEAPGKEGTEALLNDLMGYGTASLDRLAFRAEVDKIGAFVDAGTGFSARALAKDFPRAVELLADNQLHPALPAAALDALKKQQVPVYAKRLESPDYLTSRALSTALLPASDPALRQATGETVASLTRADLVAYHAKAFRPDMAAILVIGDITPKAARALVETYFGGWKAEGPKPNIDLPQVPNNAPATVTVPNPAKSQDEVTLMHTLAMTRKNPDFYALALGNAVLGGAAWSRLYDDLRVKNGLVYYAYSGLNADRTRGSFSASFGSDPDKALKARAIIVQDIKDMQVKPVSEDKLREAKGMLVRQIPLRESSIEAIAGGYLSRFSLGLPMDENIRAAKHYVALTPAEVMAAFKTWLRPDDLVMVVQGPEPRPEPK